MELSRLEKFSVTYKITRKIACWDTASKGSLGARVIGCLSTPFTLLIDAIAHSALFVYKLANFYSHLFTQVHSDMDYEDKYLLSAGMHIARAGANLGLLVLVPALCAIYPSGAAYFSDPKTLFA